MDGGGESIAGAGRPCPRERNSEQPRLPIWTESIAVGDEEYVAKTKKKLSALAGGREIIPAGSIFALREPPSPYDAHFDVKNSP